MLRNLEKLFWFWLIIALIVTLGIVFPPFGFFLLFLFFGLPILDRIVRRIIKVFT